MRMGGISEVNIKSYIISTKEIPQISLSKNEFGSINLLSILLRLHQNFSIYFFISKKKKKKKKKKKLNNNFKLLI